MSQEKESRKVVFRRIGGRIIPISVAAVGGVVAADAARTTRIYSKGALTIDKKKFAMQPFVYDRLGTRLELRVKGKKAGTASFFRGAHDDTLDVVKGLMGKQEKAKEFAFSWLGIKNKFRGQGLSKILSHESAKEIKRQGGKEIWNQVVHPNSLKTNYSPIRDKLFKVADSGASKKVGLKKAIGNIKYWRNKKGILGSDIFRETSLKHVKGNVGIKPFRTLGNKLKIGLGITAFLGGLAAYKLMSTNNKGNR